MILADTSIWIDHFRRGDKYLRRQLDQGQIVTHPLVVGELALGSLRDRNRTLALLDLLPQARVAEAREVRHLIETRALYSMGVGIVDAQLIASTLINPATFLWTRDKALRRVAGVFGIHAALP